jgi:hypothetical protein
MTHMKHSISSFTLVAQALSLCDYPTAWLAIEQMSDYSEPGSGVQGDQVA